MRHGVNVPGGTSVVVGGLQCINERRLIFKKQDL